MSAPPSPAMSFQGMSMEDKVRYLTEQLAQRDETLNTMKIKTKEYVTKLKQDAQLDIEKVKDSIRNEYENKIQDLQQEMSALRASSSSSSSSSTIPTASIPPVVEIDIESHPIVVS